MKSLYEKKNILACTMVGISGVGLLVGGMPIVRVSEPAAMALLGIGLVGFSRLIKNTAIKRLYAIKILKKFYF